MAADVLDPTNQQINDFLLDIREQLREAWASAKYGHWDGTVTFQPRQFSELDSGCRYRKRLTATGGKP